MWSSKIPENWYSFKFHDRITSLFQGKLGCSGKVFAIKSSILLLSLFPVSYLVTYFVIKLLYLSVYDSFEFLYLKLPSIWSGYVSYPQKIVDALFL